jgi:pyruvate formate-lyase activating enzyme-like uncharacterized protein
MFLERPSPIQLNYFDGHAPPMKKIVRMQKGSSYSGRLPKGCVLCEKGAKMVLLVTGKCDKKCFYCPLSNEKRGKDVYFANERRVERPDELVDEARLMDALGTGITGGDPLLEVDRTVEAIKALKKRFGKSHHIHLYTTQTDGRKIRKVAKAGLDEIRFHPPLAMWRLLERSPFENAVVLSRRLGMDVGLELPVIPGRERDLIAAIRFADENKLDFVNLNELEFSETNWKALRKLDFDVRDDVSSGVDGSERLALDLLRLDTDVPLHYCSASFKDGVQLRRRIMRRAKNVKKPYEILTRDGTFLKGIIETNELSMTAAWILKRFGAPGELIRADPKKMRLEIAPWVLEDIAGELDMPAYIIEEYPTADRLEVERIPLKRR